jgi:hypothetical protein
VKIHESQIFLAQQGAGEAIRKYEKWMPLVNILLGLFLSGLVVAIVGAFFYGWPGFTTGALVAMSGLLAFLTITTLYDDYDIMVGNVEKLAHVFETTTDDLIKLPVNQITTAWQMRMLETTHDLIEIKGALREDGRRFSTPYLRLRIYEDYRAYCVELTDKIEGLEAALKPFRISPSVDVVLQAARATLRIA